MPGLCSACPAGKYKNVSGSGLCVSCWANSHSDPGSSACACNVGYGAPWVCDKGEPDAASAHSLALGSRCTAAACANDTARLALGMIMSELTIDRILPAGPASECSALDPGDRLLKVDGIDVDADNFQQLLRGCDQPGSLVTLTIMKGEPSAVHVDSLHSLMPVLAPWSY